MSVSGTYAALPSAICHLLHVLSGVVTCVYVCVCVRCCPCRLPRDPPAADDGPAEVPPGEGRGAEGLLPAAQRHPGGALQEGCGEEQNSAALVLLFPSGANSSISRGSSTPSIKRSRFWPQLTAWKAANLCAVPNLFYCPAWPERSTFYNTADLLTCRVGCAQ